MPKRHVDILLFIEHIARELDIACAIKFLLFEKYDLSVDISWMVFEESLERYEPHVVAVPFCYAGVDGFFLPVENMLRPWRKSIWLNLAYEQIYQKIDLEIHSPRDVFAQRHVLHHAWSDLYASYLGKYGVPRENVLLNGNPAYALYGPPYVSYFQTKHDLAKIHGLDETKPWVLIPENFGPAFQTPAMFESLAHKYSTGGHSRVEVQKYRDFSLSTFNVVAKWCRKAAESENVEIIVRPRPTTARTVFSNAFQRAAGSLTRHLHIIKDGTVREWIMASDVVASSLSTTLIEASIARKAIYMLAPEPVPDLLFADWFSMVPKVNTLTEFLEAVGHSGRAAGDTPLHSWAQRTMMSRGDAIAGLVQLLASTCRGEIQPPDPPDLSDLPHPVQAPARFGFVRELVRRAQEPQGLRGLAQSAITRLGSLGKPRWYAEYELDVLHDSEVIRRTSKWAGVLGKNGASERKRLDPA